MKRTYDSLKAFGVEEHALLYQGTIESFTSEFSVEPTMVFVDADHRYEGVKRDLEALSGLLRAGVPVLCHDYSNPENDRGEYGIRRAATEWEESGYAEFRGTFGCAALFVTTNRCRGSVSSMSDDAFARKRDALLRAYGILPGDPVTGGPARGAGMGRSLRAAVRSAKGILESAARRIRSPGT